MKLIIREIVPVCTYIQLEELDIESMDLSWDYLTVIISIELKPTLLIGFFELNITDVDVDPDTVVNLLKILKS